MFPSLSLSSLKHLQIHPQRLLNRVLGDELDKVIDISLSVRRQLVYGWLPHHGLCELSGVICKWNKSCALIYNFFYEYWHGLEFIAKYIQLQHYCGESDISNRCWKLVLFFCLLHILPSTRILNTAAKMVIHPYRHFWGTRLHLPSMRVRGTSP